MFYPLTFDFNCSVCFVGRFTKPATFADCVGDELPYGWEQSYNSVVGMYYINHLCREYDTAVCFNWEYVEPTKGPLEMMDRFVEIHSFFCMNFCVNLCL